MSSKDEDYVQIPVPRKHLTRIYGYIGSLDGLTGTDEVPTTATEPAEEKTWDHLLIARQFNESPDSMKKFQKYLAAHPGQEFSTPEMATGLGVAGGWNSIAGALGAYGRRVKNRYGMSSFPFESRWDHATGTARHSMTPEVAEIINSL